MVSVEHHDTQHTSSERIHSTPNTTLDTRSDHCLLGATVIQNRTGVIVAEAHTEHETPQVQTLNIDHSRAGIILSLSQES